MDLPVIRGFYAVHPIPEASWHIKVGFSVNIANRVRSYQTLCPQVRLIRAWECPDQFVEQEAISRLIEWGFERIGFEVFRCDDLERFLACLDGYFFLHRKSEWKIYTGHRQREGEEAYRRRMERADLLAESTIQRLMEKFNNKALQINEELSSIQRYLVGQSSVVTKYTVRYKNGDAALRQ